VTVPAGGPLLVSLASAAASGTVALYISAGTVPTPYRYDCAANVAGQPSLTVIVPQVAAPRTYYVLAHSISGAAATAAYTLTASQNNGLGVTAVELSTGGNTGRVTVPVHGTLLTRNTEVSLLSGSTVIPAASLFFQDASFVYATFDLTGAATGAYDVKAADSGQIAVLPGAFHVVAGQAADVGVTLTTPDAVRLGRTGSIAVQYSNPGNTDAEAPLLILTADHASLRLDDRDGYQGGSLQLLGISHSGPAGILRPGQREQVTISFQSLGPANEDINFRISPADDSKTMDWTSFKAAAKPPYIPADAWDAVYANLTANLGATVASYRAALAGDATYLSQLGEYTAHADDLFAFETRKADAADAAGIIASFSSRSPAATASARWVAAG
jgi:hypothetical protein